MIFENIIGNNKIKDMLNETVSKSKILNSYMFVGQEGIGKKLFANEFAKSILCLSKEKEDCNNCESCIKFISSNHPDFEEVQPDGNYIKIAQIRKMQESIYQKPILSDKKVFIINNADLMTEEAQNSLLKTLEEPPQYVVIILIVSNENLLLNTIKSRCMKIYFNNISKNEMISYIEKNKLIENPTENLLDICNGSIGKAQNIKEKIEQYNEIEKFTDNIINKKFQSVVDLMNNAITLYKSKDNIDEYLEYMIVIVYNLIKKESIQTQKININYFNIIKIIENAKIKLDANSNYDMTIDELLFKIWEQVN